MLGRNFSWRRSASPDRIIPLVARAAEDPGARWVFGNGLVDHLGAGCTALRHTIEHPLVYGPQHEMVSEQSTRWVWRTEYVEQSATGRVGMISSAKNGGSDYGPLWIPVITGVGAVVHIWLTKARGTQRAAELVLLWFFAGATTTARPTAQGRF